MIDRPNRRGFFGAIAAALALPAFARVKVSSIGSVASLGVRPEPTWPEIADFVEAGLKERGFTLIYDGWVYTELPTVTFSGGGGSGAKLKMR